MTHTPLALSHLSLSDLSLRSVRVVRRSTTSTVRLVEAPDGTRFALKALGRDAARSHECSRRFERERRALATLRHHALPRLAASGRTCDGAPFLLTPWIEGETLSARLLRGPLSPTDAARVMLDVLAALDAAHAGAFVHRDVKPSNVVVRPSGEAVLLDFGVARALDEEDLTADDWVVGTPRSLAPEQLLGGRVDERADVYAAGLLLHELLVGRHPFAAALDVDLVAAHLCTPTPPLPRRFSRELGRVVARATRKVPAERFPSARAMAVALSRAVQSPPSAGRGAEVTP